MGCNESSADTHALTQSNQKQVKPEQKKTQAVQNETAQRPNKLQQRKQEKAKGIKHQWPIDQHQFDNLPDKIKETYRKAQKQGSFEDLQFPRNQSSLGGPQYKDKLQEFLPTLVWLKPASFLNPDFVLFDGIDPDDVVQGQLGVCYCLAAISIYAKNPQKVVEIFPFYDLQLGFYVLRFYINGKPTFIVVDDYFPCHSSDNSPLFTKPKGSQIWVQLIEKAWAKIIGGYFRAQAMSPEHFMEDLTGCAAYGVWFKDKENKTEQIIGCLDTDCMIVLSSGDTQIEGIVSGHAYSLLQAIEHDGSYIFKIRNPWGAFEWNGQYGEQSSLWTPQLRQKCGQQKGDDGIFFLSEGQLSQIFVYYSIGFDQANFKYSYVEFQSQPEQSLYFKYKHNQLTNLALRITQPFDRIIKDKQYKYSPIVLEQGILENNSVTFLTEGDDSSLFGQKSVYSAKDCYLESEAGQYFVRVKVLWENPKQYNSAVLSVFCSESVAIQRIPQSEGLKLWRQLISNYMQQKPSTELDENISYSMEWMKGQLVCYAFVRQNAAKKDYKLRWTFNPKELMNCKLAVNKAKENVIEYTIKKGEKSNFGTVNRIKLNEDCEAGSAEVQII